MDRAKILDIVHACLSDLRGGGDVADRESVLLGPGALLDSLALVTLIVDVEQRLADLGINVTLADGRALSAASSPFRTVSSLAEHAWERVSEKTQVG
ncbi:MAG: hypothetical protein FJZ01_05370 [Candidatus Sericytochromatia bacterium]|nr:hypothetical protein [Candidatus Tanganyikabacteria bacterium]